MSVPQVFEQSLFLFSFCGNSVCVSHFASFSPRGEVRLGAEVAGWKEEEEAAAKSIPPGLFGGPKCSYKRKKMQRNLSIFVVHSYLHCLLPHEEIPHRVNLE